MNSIPVAQHCRLHSTVRFALPLPEAVVQLKPKAVVLDC